jgi:hypothetical protein
VVGFCETRNEFPSTIKIRISTEYQPAPQEQLEGLGNDNMPVYSQYVCATQIKTFLASLSKVTQFTAVSLEVRIRFDRADQ